MGETLRPSGHREYQHQSLGTERHGAQDRAGSQGPTASPLAQGRAPAEGQEGWGCRVTWAPGGGGHVPGRAPHCAMSVASSG